MYEKQLLKELESLRPDITHAADPAPPPTILPAAAKIAPLASKLDRSSTLSVSSSGGFQRPATMPAQQPNSQPPSLVVKTSGPQPISTPSPTNFMPPTQILPSDVPTTPGSATTPGGTGIKGSAPGPSAAVPSFPRTNQFVNQGDSVTPAISGFPRTNQFASNAAATPATPANFGGGPVNAPAATPITPGFPRTNQFTPNTPIMTPGFPKTNMFTPSGTNALPTPGFPKTNQFVGGNAVQSPTGNTLGAFPRTSQFISGGNPLSPPASGNASPVVANGRNQSPAPGTNSPIVRSASASPLPPQTPVKSPLAQSHSQDSMRSGGVRYQQPALPSQIQQQQTMAQQQREQIDPLTGNRVISTQPGATSPMITQSRSHSQIYSPDQPQAPNYAQSPLSASISAPPSRSQGLGDPLLGGGGMSQSMFISPTTQDSTDPLGGGTVRGGTMRGGAPNRSRLDAREAASKLANFL